MNVLDLFSGIGGFSLGLEKAGMTTVAFCEIEEYPKKVLKKNWPDIPIYNDVKELTAKRLKDDGISVDLICGGFPCQDISQAGKQEGIEAERSGLWSECARLLREVRPKYAIFENVTALISGDRGRWFQRVLWDISEAGYDAEWYCIRASDIGARHHRDRVWIVAYTNNIRCERRRISNRADKRPMEVTPLEGQELTSVRGKIEGCSRDIRKNLENTDSKRRCSGNAKWKKAENVGKRPRLAAGLRGKFDIWNTEPDVGRVAHGVPDRAHRLKGLGNAVVPQIPEMIGRAILDAENRV